MITENNKNQTRINELNDERVYLLDQLAIEPRNDSKIVLEYYDSMCHRLAKIRNQIRVLNSRKLF